MKKLFTLLLVISLGIFLMSTNAFSEGHTVAMVVKNLGNPFMDACGKGAEEALNELGDTLIFQGPATPTVEGQIEIIENLIAQKENNYQQEQIKFLERQQQVVSLQSMVNGQETERTRIAKDLHDGLGGLFSTIKMLFSTLQHEKSDLKSEPLFQKSYDMVNTASEEVRRIAHNMICLLYTSDAADDLLRVALGGRRIIEKKKTNSHVYACSTCTTSK